MLGQSQGIPLDSAEAGLMRGFWWALGIALWSAVASSEERHFASVQHNRELRGVWVASVANMHWPRRADLSPQQQRDDLVALLDHLQRARCNALFLQVRPEGDALYRSEREPWSRFLCGRQGQDPGYDPLQFAVEQAHHRHIEVHAWLNPFRAQAVPPPEAGQKPVSPHVAALWPEQVLSYGKLLWMDPAGPTVRPRLVEVCVDLARRYDLDGIHFDDYFYPYPEGDQDFPDESTWSAYRGKLTRADWRRHQVDQAVVEVRQALLQENPALRFGISPFGIPAPLKPDSISGLDQYQKLYADTQRWMTRGWIDYLAPQLYWPTSRQAQAYEVLLRWWSQHANKDCEIFPGMNVAALGSKPEWDRAEIQREFKLNQQYGCKGFILWNVAPLEENRQGLREEILGQQTQALTPPLPRTRDHQVAPPRLEVEGLKVHLTHQDQAPLRAFTVYKWESGRWNLLQLLHPDQPDCLLSAGRWAIASVCKDGQESKGVVLELTPSSDQPGAEAL